MMTLLSASIAEPGWCGRNKAPPIRMQIQTSQNECRRCGTCCSKGGPALHLEDLFLLQENILCKENLVTIRKGEPLLFLASENPRPASTEIIKIKGSESEWTCMFFERDTVSCRIYDRRPLECSLLQCWDTAELEKIAGKNLIARHDIIGPHDPVMPFIEEQERQCSLDILGELLEKTRRQQEQPGALAQLTRLVNTDLVIRLQAQERLGFSLELELFYLGRPLFVILEQFGMMFRETQSGLVLSSP